MISRGVSCCLCQEMLTFGMVKDCSGNMYSGWVVNSADSAVLPDIWYKHLR